MKLKLGPLRSGERRLSVSPRNLCILGSQQKFYAICTFWIRRAWVFRIEVTRILPGWEQRGEMGKLVKEVL